MSDDTQELRLRTEKMTREDFQAQRESFVYGNTHIENAHVTREMVSAVAKEIAAEDGQR